jgi:cytochrome c peroxidase
VAPSGATDVRETVRPVRRVRSRLTGAAIALVVSASATVAIATGPPGRPAPVEPIVPIPSGRAADARRVDLGERLFRDARLSGDQGRACVTCHPLERGGMDGRVGSPTASGAPHPRNTPTIFNVGLSSYFNWDGIADTLEAHAETVLRNPRLMNITWPELLDRLRADAGYVAGFRAAYEDGLTRTSVLDAVASFERSLATPDARFDRYLRGERAALTDGERQGYELFKTYGCVTCHQGVNIGGNMFQKFGVFPAADVPDSDGDLGRYHVTRVSRDRGVFRVPSLRNVAVTAPYFHDGRAPTLEVAVDTMARVQLGRTLQPREIALIVEFLKSLTGRYQGRPLGPDSAPERR